MPQEGEVSPLFLQVVVAWKLLNSLPLQALFTRVCNISTTLSNFALSLA